MSSNSRWFGESEPDVLEHVHRVEERAVLEDVADRGPERGQLLALELPDVLVVDNDLALVRADQADDRLEQHALAGAGRTEQRQRLALVHDEIHAVEDHLRAEALGDATDLDHVSSSLASRVSSSRISTELVTTAPVVDLPTPSAPCWVVKPR